jgi:LacI family transcriptional regulator
LEAGLDIPGDMGVLSFDNFPIADLAEPSLTTVDIDVFEMGAQAASMLFKRIDNPSAREQQSLIATRIEMRESTARVNK